MKPQIYIVNNGIDFEKAVCAMIEAQGFKCELTPESGDQGVDVIAHIGGEKVAIQCKFYSDNQVGNDAVQQVLAGKFFWDCKDAVVVTNAGFTKAAQELAGKTNVKLLHYNEINDFVIECIAEQSKIDLSQLNNDKKASITSLLSVIPHQEGLNVKLNIGTYLIGCDFFISMPSGRIAVLVANGNVDTISSIQSVKTAAVCHDCKRAWIISDMSISVNADMLAKAANVEIYTTAEFRDLTMRMAKQNGVGSIDNIALSIPDNLLRIARTHYNSAQSDADRMNATADAISKIGMAIKESGVQGLIENHYHDLWMMLRIVFEFGMHYATPQKLSALWGNRQKFTHQNIVVTRYQLLPGQSMLDTEERRMLVWKILSAVSRIIHSQIQSRSR